MIDPDFPKYCVLFVGGAAFVFWMARRHYLEDRDGGWHSYDVPFFRKIVMRDGKVADAGGTVMRRRDRQGQWHYRAQDDQEHLEDFSTRAW
jgi:hypothetical protein